jgi:hypothetical protein
MLRTTRRNRESASRKTLKRQVYAQTGGATWREYSNIGSIRGDQMTVNADWKLAIEKAVEKNLVPTSLNLLFDKNLTKSKEEELTALFDAHRYQDTLLLLSTQLTIAKVLYPSQTADKFLVDFTVVDATEKYNTIRKADTNRNAKFYAYDVFTFLNFDTPTRGKTERITYLFDNRDIDNEEMFLEPTILKNTFVHGLANRFISMKLDNTDISNISKLKSPQYDPMTRFLGRVWRRYVDKEAVRYTGHGVGGSFYLNQEFKGTTDDDRHTSPVDNYAEKYVGTWEGTFDKLINLRYQEEEGRTFYSKLIDRLCIKTEQTLNTDKEYKDIKDRGLWIDFIVDLSIYYMEHKSVRCKTLLEFIVGTGAAATTAAPADAGFIKAEMLDKKYADTNVTPAQLLLKLAPEFLSFLLHFMTILSQNEKLYYDSLPTDKQSEFVEKFGQPIANMNEA